MNLLLTSNGLMNDEIVDALATLVNRPFSSIALAFVPTAAHGIEEDKRWLVDDLVRFRRLGLRSLDIVELTATGPGDALRRLSAADVVVFGGGHSNYLLDRIESAGLDVASLLDQRVYVGISGGTIITGPHIALSARSNIWGPGTGDHDAWRPGLGLVDFYFRPHLGRPKFPYATPEVLLPVMRSLPASSYAVSDDAALAVTDEGVAIVGAGPVLFEEHK